MVRIVGRRPAGAWPERLRLVILVLTLRDKEVFPVRQEASTIYISARVPADLAHAFGRVAEARDRTISAELRQAMREHVAATSDEAAPAGRLVEDRVVLEPEHVEA